MSTGLSPTDFYLQIENFTDGPPYGNVGASSVNTPTLGPKIHALDPRTYFDSVAEAGHDPSPYEGLANAYDCPRGKAIGKAYLLLNYVDAAALNLDNSYTLTITDGTTTAVIPRMYIARSTALFGDINGPNWSNLQAQDTATQVSQSVYPANASGSSAPGTANASPTSAPTACLVELADRRRLMAQNSWSPNSGDYPNGAYNVLAAATSGQSSPACYTPTSLTGGTAAYTWQTMLDSIWAAAFAVTWGPTWFQTGDSPTLPGTAPSSVPQNFKFAEWLPWDSYHYAASRIFCELSFNPLAGSFSLVRLGDQQSGLQAAIAAAAGQITDHNDTIQGQAATVPYLVTVAFPRLPLHYGTDPTAFTIGSGVYGFPSIESLTYLDTGGLSGSGVTTWTPFPQSVIGTQLMWYDETAALLSPLANSAPANLAALKTRNNELIGWLTSYFTNANYFFRKVYYGIVTTLLPGSQISGVKWYDYGDGLYTEVRGDVDPAFLSSWEFSSRKEIPGIAENGSTIAALKPAPMRVWSPWVPQTDQLVAIGASPTPSVNSDGLIAGYLFITDPLNTNSPPFAGNTGSGGLYNFQANSSGSAQACWILPLDYLASFPIPATAGLGSPIYYPLPAANAAYWGIRVGKVIGSRTSQSQTLPLVALYTGAYEQEFSGTAYANWMPGYVRVQLPLSGPIISVVIPAAPPGRSPNIVAGQTLRYRFNAGWQPSVTSDVYDDVIGSLRLLGYGGTVPTGWGLANGTANSTANGGSNRNYYAGPDGTTLPFLRVQSSPSITGGVTGFTIDASAMSSPVTFTTGDGSVGFLAPAKSMTAGGGFTSQYALQMILQGEGSIPGGNTGNIFGPYYPPWVGVGLIERLNNSVTAAGYTP